MKWEQEAGLILLNIKFEAMVAESDDFGLRLFYKMAGLQNEVGGLHSQAKTYSNHLHRIFQEKASYQRRAVKTYNL